MLVEIFKILPSGELESVWEEPTPGSPAATKLLALVTKVEDLGESLRKSL